MIFNYSQYNKISFFTYHIVFAKGIIKRANSKSNVLGGHVRWIWKDVFIHFYVYALGISIFTSMLYSHQSNWIFVFIFCHFLIIDKNPVYDTKLTCLNCFSSNGVKFINYSINIKHIECQLSFDTIFVFST